MNCKHFVVALEDYLARHPGAPPGAVPEAFRPHAASCAACQARWQVAARSRMLLLGLRAADPEATPDPYFLTRLQTRIEAIRSKPSWLDLRSWQIAGRDLALASLLFACTLGSFLYNFHRIEAPNANEAMVLDVPHLNPQHPSDDHRHPQLADAMVNLMNP